MLNRIYIVVGLVAILVLVAAFVVPRFVAWGDYRDRMEELASGVLGAEVTILGDIDFSLLPQPRLQFSEVVVGDLEEPAVTVASVEAEFSLIEFLRDQYKLTNLVLARPVVDVTIDENGLISSGMAFAHEQEAANVSLQQTRILDGRLRVLDIRSDQNATFEDIDGELRLAALSGPFQFQGTGAHDDTRYSVRFNTSAPDGQGNSRLFALLETRERGFSLTAEGSFMSGVAPRFDGSVTYRQAPAQAVAAEEIRGDMVLESRLQASTDRLVLSGYTLLPDENRPGTRLTGAASVQLGARNSFDAVISGGVFALPPRDATEETSSQPYEVVRLLKELPAPPLPPIPGRVGVDLAEMNLRGFSLREVRVDAETDGKAWRVGQFIARLPGDTEVRGNGELTVEAGRPGFTGSVSVAVSRLDALALLWRRPAEDNPLFNLPAAYRARVILGSDALALTDGAFTLDGQSHRADLRIGFGDEPRLDVVGRFGNLDAGDSNALLALVPDMAGTGSFNVSFPEGSFALEAASADILGLAGEALAAQGDWSASGLAFDRLAARDLGGVGFDGALDARGTLAAPVVWGRGNVSAQAGDAPGLLRALDALGVPETWRPALSASLPATLALDLAEPDAEGGQTLEINGTAGAARVNGSAQLGEGLTGFASAPIEARMFLEASDAAGFSRRLGLGEEGIFGDATDMFAAVNVSGVPADGLQAQVNLSSGSERIGFRGEVALAGEEIHGNGTVELDLADIGGVARVSGGRDVSLPQVSGTAGIAFEGMRLLRLTDIEGHSGDAGFSGELSMSRTGATTQVAGAISLERASAEGLAVALFGRSGLLRFDDGPVPDGPLVIDETPWQTRGSVAVTAPQMTLAGQPWLADAGFELTWDSRRLRLASFEARSGDGGILADVTVCCAGPLAEKTVSGRATLNDIDLAGVLPPAVSRSLAGTVSGGVRFEGSGADLRAVAGSLSGEGSFSVAGLTVDSLAPETYETVAGLDDILDMEADALSNVIRMALDVGPFRAETADGAFTIAGGVARLANLSIDGQGARLSGGVDVALDTLGLNGAFTMTPRGFVDSGMIGADTARITSRLSGTLLAPERALDLDTMVAAIQTRANEIEVERLEALRLEDEARQRAAAQERNRLIEEQMRQRAEELARRAAEDAARQQQQQQPPPSRPQQPQTQPQPQAPTSPTGPLVLQPGFQQGINTPILPIPLVQQPVNQPLGVPLN